MGWWFSLRDWRLVLPHPPAHAVVTRFALAIAGKIGVDVDVAVAQEFGVLRSVTEGPLRKNAPQDHDPGSNA